MEVLRAYDPACPDALLDARELRKAFLNLVLNGMEALSRGGRLTVTTVLNAETRTVTITIEDTGAGMSEETLSRMFDLFFTTKPQGTGLGMALARSVVDLHAGELTINSTVGKGTRVAVRLPVEPALARRRRSAPMRHTVLVVDDEASIADGLRLTLEARRYAVRIAGSVATALAAVTQADAHVAIVDLILPDGDGLHLLAMLKAKDPPLEVIIMTGHVRSPRPWRRPSRGAFYFVAKPFDTDEMLMLVGKALERRRCSPRPPSSAAGWPSSRPMARCSGPPRPSSASSRCSSRWPTPTPTC